MLCSFSITTFCQLSYSSSNLIIEIDNSAVDDGKISGTNAFTMFGGVSIDQIIDPSFSVHLVKFDLPNDHFNTIEEVNAFYACGEGVLASGLIIKTKTTNFDYKFNTPSGQSGNSQYDLLNYEPYTNCNATYPGLPKNLNATNQVKLAIIDSGHKLGSPFDDRVLIHEGRNFVDLFDLPVTGNNHGTMVTSIIAGETHEYGQQIKFIPVQVMDDMGEGTLWQFFKGLNYGLDHAEISVVCLEATMDPDDVCTNFYETLLEKAHNKNKLVVAAAGNSGRNVNPNPDSYSIPASSQAASLLVVGGSSCFSGPAYFSNYGNINVDIFAPSEQIHVYPDNLATGTSFAAPQIASVVATKAIVSPYFNANHCKEFVLSNFIPHNWTDYSVTGGTFNYSANFSNSGGGNNGGGNSGGNNGTGPSISNLAAPTGTTNKTQVENGVELKAYFSNNTLSIRVNAEQDSKGTLFIQHMSGRSIIQKNVRLMSGENNLDLYQTEIGSLTAGLYIVRIKTERGEQMLQKCMKLHD